MDAPHVGDSNARVPRPPARLSDWEKGIWRETCREMIRRGIFQPCDQLMIEGYVSLLNGARQARDEHAKLGRPLTATGARGSQIEHPLIGIERRYMREAERFAATLLLTPNARLRTPVQQPDRTFEEQFPEVVEMRESHLRRVE